MSETALYQEVKKKLCHYCGYQERHTIEVKQQLSKYPELSIEAQEVMVQELKDENFLNDQRYAFSFARGKFFNNKWGKVKIYQALYAKKFPSSIIQEALEEIPAALYQRQLKKLIENKKDALKMEEGWLLQKKIVNYLLQKGYEIEAIQQVIQIAD